MGVEEIKTGEGVLYSHSETKNPDPGSFERHCHSYYELLYVVRGEGKYFVENAEYPLLPNTLLLIRPYEFHYVCPGKNTPYERYVIHFNDAALTGAVSSLGMLKREGNFGCGLYFPKNAYDREICAIFANMDAMRARFDGQPGHRSRQNAITHADLMRILLLLSVSSPHQKSADGENVIARVIEYLNLSPEREVSLDELAQRFFVSKYYLCHAFRKRTGVSVFQYLNAKRIAMACRLLEKGEPATSVAYQVGFRNYSSFYRAYCKQTGAPPVHRQKQEG